MTSPTGEIYVEFVVQGNAVKVTAIDAQSGLEATIVGPRTAAQADLRALAVAKLKSIDPNKTKPQKENAPARSGRGIIV